MKVKKKMKVRENFRSSRRTTGGPEQEVWQMFLAKNGSGAAKHGPFARLALAPATPRAIRSLQMRRSLCVAVLAGTLLSGCGGNKRVARPVPARLGSSWTGTASWYGHPYHGRRAANGEVYDMEKMTAAHRTLPFGTWLAVRNVSNGKTVNVRIIDRGPFVGGRVLDLSHAAARSIDMIGPGTAQVKFTVIAQPVLAADHSRTPPPQRAPGSFAVQIGSFTDRRNAERLRSSMESRHGSARLVVRDGQPAQWRVLVGREATEEGAASLAEQIRRDPGNAGAFVVRIDEGAADSVQ